MILKELKKGEFFKLKENSKKVYVKDEYDRSTKKFCCYNYEDINDFREFKGNKEIFIDFIY